MAQNVNPTFVKTPNAGIINISTGNGTALGFVTIYTGGANGSKITGLTITSNTSVAQDVRISVSNGTNTAFINSVSVPTAAGINSSIPPVNGFTNTALAIDSDGNPFLILPSTSWTLIAQATTNSSQWTTGNTIYLMVTSAGDF